MRGFTLIELMIVVVIVAILAAVALPSYQNSIRKSRRPDAKTALLDLAAREERYYTVNNTYTDVAANLGYASAVVGAKVNVSLGMAAKPDYTLSVSAFTATTFSLQAVAQNDQVNDTCGSYTLDNLGNQLNIHPAGTAAAAIFGCW
jgi:type IV pilus assembly protein PilE